MRSELNGDGVAFDQRVGDAGWYLELFAVNIDDVAFNGTDLATDTSDDIAL